MSEEKAILVINAIVNKENMAEVPVYLENIMPVFAKNGGKPVGRYKTVQQLEGIDSPEMIAIFEFESVDVINTMINGADFTNLSDLRARVFDKLNMVICTEL
ncbi:MAG: hypothetical protein COA49_09855 [Bacteroidetes bacterium]|nr:MAG: hypothetical protein COA49_09855 [Bacteroidota bacterium]